MVERSPGFTVLAYTVLILGIAVMVFPLYYATITASHDLETIAAGSIPLYPGGQLLRNIAAA